MTFVSKLALAATLTLGAPALLTATPALAQKKEKAPAAPKYELSAAFRKPAGEAEKLLAAKDWAGAKPLVDQAAGIAANDDERYIVETMRLQIASNTQDNAATAAALAALVAHPRTAAADLPRYNFFLGDIARRNKDYPSAIRHLTKARELGYENKDLNLLIAQVKVDSGDISGGVADIRAAVAAERAAGRKAPDAWFEYSIHRLYRANDRAAAVDWLVEWVRTNSTAENWRKALIVYRNDNGTKPTNAMERSRRLDIYRLMRATGALADQQDYFDYANSAAQIGLPWETLTVIKSGRAAGKVPASDAAFSPIETKAAAGVKAEGSLAAVEKTATSGKALAGTGDAYLASGDYANAARLYRAALAKGGDAPAAEVNLHLGMALAQSGDKEGAKAAFAQAQGGQIGEISKFWQAYLEVPVTPATAGGN